MKTLDKQKTEELLKESLGWDNPNSCQNGFWLDKYTLIKADSIQIVEVEREALTGESHTKPFPMVILNDVVEMTIDRDNKILAVENKPKIGLWLDALTQIIRNQTKPA